LEQWQEQHGTTRLSDQMPETGNASSPGSTAAQVADVVSVWNDEFSSPQLETLLPALLAVFQAMSTGDIDGFAAALKELLAGAGRWPGADGAAFLAMAGGALATRYNFYGAFTDRTLSEQLMSSAEQALTEYQAAANIVWPLRAWQTLQRLRGGDDPDDR